MDDRALVDALVSGDPRGLEGAYRAYADRLYTYCRALLRDPDAAADAVHDTFVLANQRAGQLRDPDRLRSWLYAIARNECLRLLRARKRSVPLEEAGDVSAPEEDPATGMRAAEIQELVWAAADGLNPGDREVFELTVRHELDAEAIGELLGVSVAHAHARLSRARSQLERALGALLVARTSAPECPELAELVRGWNGRLTALLRKRISRHIESCETCGEQQRRQLGPAALLAAYATLPMLVVPAELWPRLELTSFDPALAGDRAAIDERAGRFRADTGFPRPLDLARRRLAVAGVSAVAVIALLALGAGAVLLPPGAPAADPSSDLPRTAAAAAAPEPTPEAAATAVPTATPTATPTAGPTPPGPNPPPVDPAPAPGPQPGPPPPGPPPPPGQLPLAPPNPPPNPPNPPPADLTVDVEVKPSCFERGANVVVVTVTANKPLDTAEITMQSADGGPGETLTMSIDGVVAQLELPARQLDWVATVTAGRERAQDSGRIEPCAPVRVG